MSTNTATDKKFSLQVNTDFDVAKLERRQKISKIVVNTFIYICLIFLALVIIFPFYWMVNSSLKSLDEYKLATPTFWPKHVFLSNYADAFSTANLGTLFVNTLFVGLVSTILSLVITVLSAFAFARLEFKGKNALFAALLGTMMIPGELFTITNYATVKVYLNNEINILVSFFLSPLRFHMHSKCALV